MTNEAFKYGYLRYNVHGVLRPNLQLKLSLLFLCRRILMLFLADGMNFKGRAKPETAYLVQLLNPVYNITDILPALVSYAMGARTTKAKAAIHWIWKHGRQLILFSVVLFLAIFGFRTQWALSAYGAVEWAVITANVLIALYIGTPRFIRDLFNEFPPPIEQKSP